MDAKFFEQRARVLREIAKTADPFTKQRLLNLAQRYEDCLPTLSETLGKVEPGLLGAKRGTRAK